MTNSLLGFIFAEILSAFHMQHVCTKLIFGITLLHVIVFQEKEYAVEEEEDKVEVEYIAETMELTNPYFRSFSEIFEKFKVLFDVFFIIDPLPK